ncbi:MAG: FliM/FliN family flagellar motor C-terminal domain-containing protein [Rhizobacter sp.]
MNELVRPLHLPGAAALAVLRERVQVALDAWAHEWVSAPGHDAPGAATVQARSACEGLRPMPHEFDAVHTEAGCLWVRCSAEDRFNFGQAVMGAGSMPGGSFADDWVAGAVDRAWEARDRALCAALFGTAVSSDAPLTAQTPPADLFAFGSGAVEFSCQQTGLHVVADSAVWRAVPPIARSAASPLPEATPLNRAVHLATARLEVMLGSVELDLPRLMDLRCGDVLRLPQRLHQPVMLMCEGQPLAQALLGEQQGRKAVQTVAPLHDKQ